MNEEVEEISVELMDGRKEEVREEIENELSEMNEEKQERDGKVEIEKRRGRGAVGGGLGGVVVLGEEAGDA